MCDADRVRKTIEAAERLAIRLEPSKAREIRMHFENELTVTTYAPSFGGRADDDQLVVLGDWNGERGKWTAARSLLGDHLERLGVSIEWYDQYTTCSNCARAIQTQPDSYSWEPCYVIDDGEILCPDCWDEGTILMHLEGDENKCLQVAIDPSEYGYERIEDGFEAGLHPGQTDDPREIARGLRERGIERFIFKIDGKGQFDTRFSVWAPSEELEGQEHVA